MLLVDMVNPAPTRRSYTIRHGERTVNGTIEPGTTKQERIGYDPAAGAVVFESDVWCPAELISGSTDRRVIGLGIRQITFS